MYVNKAEIQKQNDALRATPKSTRSKLKQIVEQVIQKPNFEKFKMQAPEILFTPEYSIYPSAIRVTMPQPLEQLEQLEQSRQSRHSEPTTIYYPQQNQTEEKQEGSVSYFSTPATPKPEKKAEIKVDGNIVLISAANNEIITFNKKLMIGFQASIAEEKLTILLKSNKLSIQMLFYEDWANVIDTLHLLITNKSKPNPNEPTILSRLAKCFPFSKKVEAK
jgi:hypothetical protein